MHIFQLIKINTMAKYKIAILGGGNLGTALAHGLVRSGQYTKAGIVLTEKRLQRIEQLRKSGFHVLESSSKAVKESDIVVLAVKPQHFRELAAEIRSVLTESHLLISAITGVSHKDIQTAAAKIPLARIMPNIALEICESMTCMSFCDMSHDQQAFVSAMFNRMGRSLVIPEELMSSATVIGACGIAFALRFMRAMSQGGIEIGFNSEISHLITAQTIKGAAGLILENSTHPEMEIDKVTTPQGITISGLNEMEHQGLSSAVIRGLITSFNKIENMSQSATDRSQEQE
jgi:pyrroline-5-carboxylate reductase